VPRLPHSSALIIAALCALAVTALAQEPGRGRGRRGGAAADSSATAPPQDSAKAGRRGGRSGRGGTAGDTAGGARGGARSGGPGDARGGGRGGPRNASVVLGPADIYKVTRGIVEATLAVSGDLRAFENATVRTRIDGVLEKVYVREGQPVSAGMLLAKFESSEQDASLRSAEADVAAAKSDAEIAIWNAEQSKGLFKVGAIAERDQRLTEQAAEAAKARLAASESRQRAATNAVRDTKITAPFAGTIEKRLVQDGENTPRGTQLFTMVRTTTLELTGSLPARSADDVKPGQTARFTADGRSFNGKVSRVSPTIDPASRSVAVYVTVPNPKNILKGNTFATGQVVTTTIADAIVVPTSAIRYNIDGTVRFVYKVEGDVLRMVPVRTGISDEARDMVQIVDGLREQDQVVVGAPGTLGTGMKVTIISSEGARGGGRRGQKSAP
jgi:RND family efflux transporter MFP subunit